jgi:FkbM family methyltransferase
MGIRTVRIGACAINVDAPDNFWFWPAVEAGTWEPDTFRILDRYLAPDWRFVDIGAWIGPTALYAASRGATVDAFECDPQAVRALKTNIGLNPHLAHRIHLHEHALGSEDGVTTLYTSVLGDSETSIFRHQERPGGMREIRSVIQAGVRDVRRLFLENGYLACDKTLIKIDVEGAEYGIIDRLRPLLDQARCVWYLSLHPFNLLSSGVDSKYLRIAETTRLLLGFQRFRWLTSGLLDVDKNGTLADLHRTEPVGSGWVFEPAIEAFYPT